MDLNLYRIFLEVAKTGSISKAASSLFVSQPSISYSIKMLEEELKCKLFNRTAKGTELTIDGEKLLFYVEGAFNMINAGCKTVKDSENMISGEIRVGVPTHIGIFLLSKYIQKFIEKYPGIKFTIVNRATSEMVDMLEKRNLDFIVDSYPIDSNRKDIVLYKLIEVSNCFVGNEKYKNIVNEGIINIEDIQKYPLLLPPKITSTRKALESKLKDRIDNLEAIIDVPTTEVMLELVKKGLGIGYFTKESVQKYIDSGRLYEIPVDVELPKTDICIAYVDNFLANAPKKFIEMLNSEIKSASYTKEKSLRLILTQECTYNCSMCHKEGIHSKKENLLTNEDFAYIYEIANKEYGINKVTLSRELSKTELEDILKYNLDIDTELIVYGTLPIMSCNYCFLGKSNMCYPECKRLCSDDNSYYLKDRLGFKFRIVSDNIQSITSIFNSKILSISPKTFNVSSVRIDILDENVTTINKIIETVKSGKSFEGKEYTSGRLEEEK